MEDMDAKPLADFVKTMGLNLDPVPDEQTKILTKIIHKRVWQYILKNSSIKSREVVPSNQLLIIDTYIQRQARYSIYNRRALLSFRYKERKSFTKLQKLQDTFRCRLERICRDSTDLVSHADGVANARLGKRPFLHHVITDHDETLHIKKNLEDCGCILIKMLIDEGSDVNAFDDWGLCLLSEALNKSSPGVLKMLLDTGRIDIHSKNSDRNSPIFLMKYDEKNPENFTLCLHILKRHGFHGNVIGNHGNSPMHEYLQNRFIPQLPFDAIKSFIEVFNPNLGMKNFFGLTPLHVFIQNVEDEEIQILDFLLSKLPKKVINEGDITGKTPLHYTVERSTNLFCERLLSNGAVVNIRDKNWCTPLHCAIRKNIKMFELLFQYGGNANLIDCHGDQMIVYAAASSNLEIFRLLLQDKDVSEMTENRLVHIAYLNDNRKVFQSLSLAADTSCTLEYNSMGRLDKETEFEFPRTWVNQAIAAVKKNRQEKNISQMKKFFDLEQARQFENCQILDDVTTLIFRISEKVTQSDPQLRFSPVLSGSCSEGTKIGILDEVDFLCQLKFLSELDITAHSDVIFPAFYQLQVDSNNHHVDLSLLKQFKGITLLSSEAVGKRFTFAVFKAFSDAKIWENLHLSLGFTEIFEQRISCINLLWTGRDFKLKEISIDLVPTITVNLLQELPKRANKLLEKLQLQHLLQESLFVCKMNKKDSEGHSNTFWRVSHSLIETNIFKSLPHSVRDGYKLVKLLRTGGVLDPLGPLNKWSLTSYHLKTCLFYKLSKALMRRKLNHLKTMNPRYWAVKILHCLKSFSKQNGSVPNFFVKESSLDIDNYDEFLEDFCKVGCIWLKYPWDSFRGI